VAGACSRKSTILCLLWNLLESIPTIENDTINVRQEFLAFNKQHPTHANSIARHGFRVRTTQQSCVPLLAMAICVPADPATLSCSSGFRRLERVGATLKLKAGAQEAGRLEFHRK
jgi:hypothetical protein